MGEINNNSAYFTIPLQSEFAELVKSTRKDLRLNQQEVVDLISKAGGQVSLRAYSNYELGLREPKISAAYWIMKVLGLLGEGEKEEVAQQIPMSKWNEMAFNEVDEGYAAVRKEGEVQYYMKYRFQKMSREDVENE